MCVGERGCWGPLVGNCGGQEVGFCLAVCSPWVILEPPWSPVSYQEFLLGLAFRSVFGHPRPTAPQLLTSIPGFQQAALFPRRQTPAFLPPASCLLSGCGARQGADTLQGSARRPLCLHSGQGDSGFPPLSVQENPALCLLALVCRGTGALSLPWADF